MPTSLNQQRLAPLHPKVQALATQLLAQAKTAGINLLITQGLRTWADQDALYALGRTAPGNIVTYAKAGQSWHNYGLAFDIVPLSSSGKADWDTSSPAWQTVADMGKAIGLTWGGDWPGKKRDLPHFQFTGPLSLAQAQALYASGGIPKVWEQVA